MNTSTRLYYNTVRNVLSESAGFFGPERATIEQVIEEVESWCGYKPFKGTSLHQRAVDVIRIHENKMFDLRRKRIGLCSDHVHDKQCEHNSRDASDICYLSFKPATEHPDYSAEVHDNATYLSMCCFCREAFIAQATAECALFGIWFYPQKDSLNDISTICNSKIPTMFLSAIRLYINPGWKSWLPEYY
jgi:hypothetical protein